MAPRVLKTVQAVMSIFETILIKWTGTRLKADKNQETTGKRRGYTEYTLIVRKRYLHVLSIMKPLENTNLLETKQLQSVAQQLNDNQPQTICQQITSNINLPAFQLEVINQPIISQSTILELLVDFGIKHSKSPLPIPPLHLTNCIRERGYNVAFKSYKILASKVVPDINKYLSQFNISWNLLYVTPITLFKNIKTKYDN
jgi:hypothetical protein